MGAARVNDFHRDLHLFLHYHDNFLEHILLHDFFNLNDNLLDNINNLFAGNFDVLGMDDRRLFDNLFDVRDDEIIDRHIDNLLDLFGLEINLLTEVRLLNLDLGIFIGLRNNNLGGVFFGVCARL